MASVKSTNITNLDASPSTLPDAREVSGKLRVFTDTYEASSLAAGSDITVARIPTGAKIIDIKVIADALGGSVTLAVGDSTDPDRYITATAMNTADKVLSLLGDGEIAGHNYEVTSTTNDILITTAGAAATGTIQSTVIYSVE